MNHELIFLVPAVLTSILVAVVARLHSTQTSVDFQLAGRGVGVITNAAAICGDYISAASFLGVAAAVYATGLDGAWTPIGFAAGFIPVTLFVAAPLRRFGDRSLSDFLGDRFESEPVRLVAVAVVELIVLMYLIPQAVAGGLAWDLLLGTSLPGLDPYETGIVLSTLLIGVLVTVGGMRGTTWNQALQFVVLLAVLSWLVIALVADGWRVAGGIASASESPLLAPVVDPTGEAIGLAPVASHLTPGEAARFDLPGAQFGAWQNLSLMVTLVFGTAGLPHVMNRLFTSPSGRAARATTAWVIGLIGVFYMLAITAGTASRSVVAEKAPTTPWLQELTIDGVLETPEYGLLALGRLYGGQLGLSVIATGALIAIMSTVGGLLLAASASWGHDVYERHLNRRATRRQALHAGQLAVVVMAVIAAIAATLLHPDRVSISTPSVIASLVTAAFAVAGATLTPALLLAIWWKRATATGVLVGLGVGTVVALSSTLYGLIGESSPALLRSPGLITSPLAALIIIVVSWFGTPPDAIESMWVKMHGSAQDRRVARLSRLTLEETP